VSRYFSHTRGGRSIRQTDDAGQVPDLESF